MKARSVEQDSNYKGGETGAAGVSRVDQVVYGHKNNSPPTVPTSAALIFLAAYHGALRGPGGRFPGPARGFACRGHTIYVYVITCVTRRAFIGA
jgi:hypothetical protein